MHQSLKNVYRPESQSLSFEEIEQRYIHLKDIAAHLQKCLSKDDGEDNLNKARELVSTLQEEIKLGESSIINLQDYLERIGLGEDDLRIVSESDATHNPTNFEDSQKQNISSNDIQAEKQSFTTSQVDQSLSSDQAVSKIYRFFLRAGATAKERREFKRDLELTKQLNPQWEVMPDYPQIGEEEAAVMIYKDEEYWNRHVAYLVTRSLTGVL